MSDIEWPRKGVRSDQRLGVAAIWRLCAMLLLLAGVASGEEVLIDPGLVDRDLDGHYTFLSDPGGTLTLERVIIPPIADQFQPLPGALNRGYTDAVSWLRLTLQRQPAAPTTLYLWMEPPITDHVDLYLQSGRDPADSQSYQRHRLSLLTVGDDAGQIGSEVQGQGPGDHRTLS